MEFKNLRQKQCFEERYNIFLANNYEDSEDVNNVLVVEVPVKHHNREDVKTAKINELMNLDRYDVFERVKDNGQEKISARWVITEKEKHDRQKVQVKA